MGIWDSCNEGISMIFNKYVHGQNIYQCVKVWDSKNCINCIHLIRVCIAQTTYVIWISNYSSKWRLV